MAAVTAAQVDKEMSSMSDVDFFQELDDLVFPFSLANETSEQIASWSKSLLLPEIRRGDPWLLPALSFDAHDLDTLVECPVLPSSPELDDLEIKNWAIPKSSLVLGTQSSTDCPDLSFSDPMTEESCWLSTPTPVIQGYSLGWQRNSFNVNGKRAIVQKPSPVKRRRFSYDCPMEDLSQQALEEALKEFIHDKWLVHGKFYTRAQIEKDPQLHKRWKDQGEGKLYKQGFPRLSGEKMRAILRHHRAGGDWRDILMLTSEQQEALEQVLEKAEKKSRR